MKGKSKIEILEEELKCSTLKEVASLTKKLVKNKLKNK